MCPRIITGQTDGEEGHLKGTQDEPFSGLVFKIMNDPFVGQLSYIRIYSGKLNTGETVLNSSKGKTERIGRISSFTRTSGRM